jgi:hypothetical protein
MAQPVVQNCYLAREMVLSTKKQAVYGTAAADADLVKRVLFDSAAFVELAKDKYSDAELAGKGHYFATYPSQDIANMTALKIRGQLDDSWAGWLAAFSMFALADTGAGPYTHTFTPLLSSAVAPVATIYTEDGMAIKRKWADMCIDQLAISGADKGPLTFDADLLGSGKFTNGAIAGLPALPGTRTVMMSSDVDIKIGAPAAAASLAPGRVASWGVAVKNNLTARRGPGGGLVAVQTTIGQPQYSLTDLTILGDSTDDVMSLFENGTQQEVQININSGAAAQMNFKFGNLYFSAGRPQRDSSGLVAVSVSSDPNMVLKVGANNPLQIVVIDGVTTYLN